MDEFIVQKLADLSKERSQYYQEVFTAKLSTMLQSDPAEAEYREIETAVKKLREDIAAQVRNLREADSTIRRFIQEDISAMSEALQKQEQALQRIKDERNGKQQINQELDEVRRVLLSFAEFAKTASPEVMVTLIQSVVDRIYIVTADGITKCHIYLKGCPDEDYSNLIGTADYISICAILIPVVSHLCDCDRYRELHPYLCRDAAAAGVRGNHAETGPRGGNGQGKDHQSL